MYMRGVAQVGMGNESSTIHKPEGVLQGNES